jgi:hypothetical protein
MAMNILQFSPVIQPTMITNPFTLIFDNFKYTVDISGEMKCRGPWIPRSCFPRKVTCFQGHSFSVNVLCRRDPIPGEVHLFFVPSSIEIIYPDCFGSNDKQWQACRSLEVIVFEPDSRLRYLGNNAFYGCRALKCIYLPAAVESVCSACFADCCNFAHFGFEPDSRLNLIGERVFQRCLALKSIIIPASVSDLSIMAFSCSGIDNIAAISIEEANENFQISGDCIVDINSVRLVHYFGSSSTATLNRDIEILGRTSFAFASLSDLRFESGSRLSRMLDLAFANCNSLRSIVIPSSVTTISGATFALSRIQSIYVDEGNSHFHVIGQFLLDFSGKSVIRYFGSDRSICVSRQIEVLREFSFAFCGEIQELSFESGSVLREVHAGVFLSSTQFKAIMLPASVRKIDGSAFHKTRITSIKVASDSSNFTTDGPFLLDSDGGLVRYFGSDSAVTISRKIVALRLGCFNETGNFRQLLFESESTLTELEPFLFGGRNDIEVIDLPPSLRNVHGSTFASAAVLKISVDPRNGHLRVIGDFLIDVARLRLIHYFGSSTAIILSQSVEIIGSYCFSNCGGLRKLIFETGSKLTRIGRNAFAGCSLQSIVIPASVTEIGGGAFAYSGIRQISIEDGSEHFCIRGQFLLDITQASLIAFVGVAATVTISSEIRVLCDSCFLGCKTLSRLNFEPGSQLRRIERLAFGGCSSLHMICIPSSIESLEREWFLNSHFTGGVVFDTVQFESYESLSKMVYGDCADLSGDFSIEVSNLNGEGVIPGYFVDAVISNTLVRLKKSSEGESSVS